MCVKKQKDTQSANFQKNIEMLKKLKKQKYTSILRVQKMTL